MPTRNGIADLLKPRAWRYHSLTELSVDLRVRSKMNRSATASLQTSGSMFCADVRFRCLLSALFCYLHQLEETARHAKNAPKSCGVE